VDSDTQRAYADAESRRLTLGKLAGYLEAQRTALTEQWLLAVRRDPEIAAADRLTHQQLVDHLPEIYAECCNFLRTRDAAALVGEAKNDAQEHGILRWQDGYNIDELIRELEVFRRILTAALNRFAEIDPQFRGPIEASANLLLQQYFGEVTVNSVSQYAQQQQAVVRSYTEQLEVANRELSRTNSSLKQALTERQRLTAVIAHEVRTFLQGLSYAARSWDEQSSSALADAQAQLKDVEVLLNQLLDHSTLIANREPPVIAEFEPAALHAELTRMYEPAAHQRGLSFVGDCSAVPARIRGDRLKIKQIVTNLLSNALKYTIEGHISLVFGAATDPGRWTIHVSDTGPGLAPEAAERLFGGIAGGGDIVPRRGIGLAITKDLVDLLGGSIQVISKSGAGTVIAVTMPTELEQSATTGS
jgi:signal transduction histidine kinase